LHKILLLKILKGNMKARRFWILLENMRKFDFVLNFLNFFCCFFYFLIILKFLYYFGILDFGFFYCFLFENFDILINNWIMHKDYLKFIVAYYYLIMCYQSLRVNRIHSILLSRSYKHGLRS
jgi:hypothetical protein